MTYREVVCAALEVDQFNVCVDRATLFRTVPCSDPYIDRKGDELLVNVYSEVPGPKTFFEFAKRKCLNRFQSKKKKEGGRFDVGALKILTYVFVEGRPLFGVGSPLVPSDVYKAREKIRERLTENQIQHENYGMTRKCIDHKTGEICFKIFVVAKNHCWARMLLAKELSHLCVGSFIFDDGENYILTPADKILRMAEKWRQNIAGPEGVLKEDEVVGFYHALEVMIPWSLRRNGGVMFLPRQKDPYTHHARRFMIPKKIVEEYFKLGGYGMQLFPNDPQLYRYFTFSHKVNEMIEEGRDS